jgi:hypothetical protein
MSTIMLPHSIIAGKLNLAVLTSWQEGVSSSGDMGVRHVELVQSTRVAVVSDGVLAWRPAVLVFACCFFSAALAHQSPPPFECSNINACSEASETRLGAHSLHTLVHAPCALLHTHHSSLQACPRGSLTAPCCGCTTVGRTRRSGVT